MHTETPWEVGEYGPDGEGQGYVNIWTVGEGAIIAQVLAEDVTGPVCKANAEFIVRAVNCHDELVAACEATIAAYASHQLYDKCPLDQLKAAVAKAKERERDRLAALYDKTTATACDLLRLNGHGGLAVWLEERMKRIAEIEGRTAPRLFE